MDTKSEALGQKSENTTARISATNHRQTRAKTVTLMIETDKQVEEASGRAKKTRHLQVTMLAANHIGYRSTTRCQNASRNHFSEQESWYGVQDEKYQHNDPVTIPYRR